MLSFISPTRCFRIAVKFTHAPPLLSLGLRKRATRLGAMRSTSSGPPLEPKDFGLNFKVERYTTQLHLEQFNAHPMDNAVVYDEVNHAYYINGKKMDQSVTGIVESCFEKFNPQVVAERMIQGSNWPRAGYMQQDGKTPMTLEDILKKWSVSDSVCIYICLLPKLSTTCMTYCPGRHRADMPPITEHGYITILRDISTIWYE